MNRLLTFFFTLTLWCQLAVGQEEITEVPLFNSTKDHQVGVGFAITSFSSNFTYFVSPYYAFRIKRHWIAATPFYGRLDALSTQQDIAVGFDYRFYPFRNLSRNRYYIPAGVHYTYTWTKNSNRSGLFYTLGAGSEADLGKNFILSLDANFGIGQILNSNITSSERRSFGLRNRVDFYFLPTIRIAYRL